MTNPFPVEASYGAGPYPYTLRIHVPQGTGRYSDIDIDLSQFPKDETNAPDPAAIKAYIEEQLDTNAALTLQILVNYPDQVAGSTTYPDITGSIEETYDGMDAINEYLGLALTPPPPPPPVISALSPTQSSAGANVAITGTGFTGATAVKFGSLNAESFTVNSDISITARTPLGAGPGTVNVTVTTPAGTSPGVQFTFF